MQVPEGDAAADTARTVTKKFDLSPDSDDFWMEYGQTTFERVMGL